MLSLHFSVEEFTASQTAARLGIDNSLPADFVKRASYACVCLDDVRELLGNKPIFISSGYRCPELNKAIPGSAPNSSHMQAYAFDWTCPSFGTPFEVCKFLANSGIRFNQLIYEYKNWIHIDFMPNGKNEVLTIDKKGVRVGLFND
jgi:hypothetical protein